MDNIIETVNKISQMNGNNLLDKIMDYCETYDKDPQEIGDFLQASEDFKNLLYRDCVKNHIIKDSNMVIHESPDVW